MSHEWLALISALPGLLAFLTALLAWLKSRQAVAVVADTKDTINDLHLSINSKMDRLLAVVEEAAHAKGMAEGRAAAVGDAAVLQAAADHAQLAAGGAAPAPPPSVAGPVIVTGSPVEVTGGAISKEEENK